jgi:RES domain-containing protein
MITAWHLVQDLFLNDPFSGEGARLYGGRWNHAGVSVVYVSEHLSLAVLEQFVHMNGHIPEVPFSAIKVEIPKALAIDNVVNLPPDWQADPAPESTKAIGDAWVRSGKTTVLKVPSVVVPVEYNYVLNPAHSDFKRIQIGTPEPFYFDSRMWHTGGGGH